MFPHVATVYNHYRDGRGDKWQRTVLESIFWDNTRGINARTGAIDNDDSALIIIPCIDRFGYLPPKEFSKTEDKSGSWTLQPGDKIVFGSIDFEIDETHRLAELESDYDDVLTITKVDRHLFGSSLDHWEVGAK